MARIYVGPRGEDTADGSVARPLASLREARDRLRASGDDQNVLVVLPGTYYDVQLELTAADNGLTVSGQVGTCLVGGRRISGWTVAPNGWWSVELDGVAAGDWDFRMLRVAGALAPRARYPEAGALSHESRFDARWLSTTAGGWDRQPTEEELTTLQYRPGDLGDSFVPENAEVQIYHQWDESVVGVESIDRQACRLRFSSCCGHPPGAFHNHGHNAKATTYVVWNTVEGMSRPGQWYLDRRAGRLWYWPRPGDDRDALEVVAPTTENLVRLLGTEGAPLRAITLAGLDLSVATSPLRTAGFGASLVPGAIEIHGPAEQLCFEDLSVHHVGGSGIHCHYRPSRKLPGAMSEAERQTVREEALRRRCTEVAVRRCRVSETGASGIHLRGRGVTVSDCSVRNTGRCCPSAIALRVGGAHNRILHNEVRGCPYSAIVAGGPGNRIEHNRIEEFMQALDDGAAIYCFAFKNGLYRGNVAVGTSGRLAHAYYLDEQSAGSVVEQNLAVNTRWPSHNHMAKDCVIRDNIFLDDGDAKLTFMRCEGFVFERNVVCAAGSIALHAPAEGFAALPANLFHAGSGRIMLHRLKPDGYGLAESLPLPLQDASRTGVPGFHDPADWNFRFAEDSPARVLGLLELDFSRAGPRVR